MSKLKEFTGDKVNVTQKLKFVFNWKENTGGILFPTMFSKVFFFMVIKSLGCVAQDKLAMSSFWMFSNFRDFVL